MSAGDWKEMYSASISGDLDLVNYHLSQGVDPNYEHPEILSLPLVGAILNGHTEVAITLLKAGADPKLKSSMDGMNSLEAAKKMKNQDVLNSL